MALPFAGTEHFVQALPQASTFVLFATQELPTLQNPELQVNPQAPPLQVAVPFAGALQLAQDAPQVFVLVFATHVFPTLQKPVLQFIPQLPPLQVAVPFAGAVQLAQDVPQVLVLVFETQVFPTLQKPVLHEMTVQLPFWQAV